MSQSSETTRGVELLALGYPEQRFANEYYTSRVSEGFGVCVSPLASMTFIQFFPWVGGIGGLVHGHARYAAFITKSSQSTLDKYRGLPYYKIPLDTDVLTIKCLIEEGIKECQSLVESP